MSGRAPSWLGDWIGAGIATHDDAASWQLLSAWPLPVWATVLLVLGTAAFTILLYARESSAASVWYRSLLVALRMVVIAVMLMMIAQWALMLRVTGPSPVAVLVDRSASMGAVDPYDQTELPEAVRERLAVAGSKPSRLNLAKMLLIGNDAGLLRELAQRYRLEMYFAAEDVERLPATLKLDAVASAVRQLEAEGPGSQSSRLGDAVRQVLEQARGIRPSAVLLFSDGNNTDGIALADAAEEGRGRGVPLFTIGLGSARPPRDIELTDVLVDDIAFVNDLVSFRVQVRASGLEGEQATLMLRRSGQSAPVAEEPFTLPPGGQTLELQLTDRPPEAGELTYTVEVEPRDSESDTENNRQTRIVRVVDQKVRVLLISGYPSYEFRYLKTALEREPTVDLATYLQDADPSYAEQDKTAIGSISGSQDELASYDVIIVADVDPRFVPRSFWPNLRSFVAEHAGGVAFIAGPRYVPHAFVENEDVRALLPVEISGVAASGGKPVQARQEGFQIVPTPLGLRHSVMQLADSAADNAEAWRALAPLYWFSEAGKLKPGAQVLAQASAQPAIVFQFVGAGRVLWHAIDETWRWRLGEADAIFTTYWVQAVRQLARGKLAAGGDVQLTSDRRAYDRGEAVRLRARFPDATTTLSDEVVVVVEARGQPRRRIKLHRRAAADALYEGVLRDLAAGQYEAMLVTPEIGNEPPVARFSVTEPAGEMSPIEMDAVALQRAAEITGGRFYTIDDADELVNDLPPPERVAIEDSPPMPLWNRWWLLSLFVAALTAEWILRKRSGML